MSIETLVQFSNHYGADARFVLAGGGNTSYKNEEHLYIKGSGTSLATITADTPAFPQSLSALTRTFPLNNEQSPELST